MNDILDKLGYVIGTIYFVNIDAKFNHRFTEDEFEHLNIAKNELDKLYNKLLIRSQYKT